MTAGVTAAFCILLRSFPSESKVFFYLPVYADCDEVEYRRCGANDVHGDVRVAPDEREGPQAVDLRETQSENHNHNFGTKLSSTL